MCVFLLLLLAHGSQCHKNRRTIPFCLDCALSYNYVDILNSDMAYWQLLIFFDDFCWLFALGQNVKRCSPFTRGTAWCSVNVGFCTGSSLALKKKWQQLFFSFFFFLPSSSWRKWVEKVWRVDVRSYFAHVLVPKWRINFASQDMMEKKLMGKSSVETANIRIIRWQTPCSQSCIWGRIKIIAGFSSLKRNWSTFPGNLDSFINQSCEDVLT